ncbi:hypothetical protein ACP70R_014672 [Stipagrostis hirtigluma subsp. patula]
MAEQTEPSVGAGDGENRDQLLQKLASKVERLCNNFNAMADSSLADRDELREIFEVLEKIKPKIDDGKEGDGGDQLLLPVSKREELAMLLPKIEHALASRKQRQPAGDAERPAEKKSGCNPFKARSPAQRRRGVGGRRREEEEEAVSLKLLLQLAKHVLEPEQYYEWTTSYVDESRIYGWDKDADKVVEALVGPKDGDGGEKPTFRAAGIAGIHGSGKTALAQKVFVHDGVKDAFPLRLWVCVGPPDSEDRFCLLYRMLDNLGLDTYKVEDIVNKCNVVTKHREEEKARILGDAAAVAGIKKKAAAQKRAKEEAEKKPDDVTGATSKEEGDVTGATGKEEGGAGAPAKGQEDSFNEVLMAAVENTAAVQKSKIARRDAAKRVLGQIKGVLLFILHEALSKTGYLIVFDDIRVYGDDGWYSNLTLPPPPDGEEWVDRLAYGLPKTGAHKSAVLVTCRKEEDARAMVRAGTVFRPPKLEVEDGWKLFKREYDEAKKLKDAKSNKEDGKDGGKGKAEDLLFKELEEMKEAIVKKCLGLPVAIVEAARGFALSDLEPLPEPEEEEAAKPAVDQTVSSSNKELEG